MPPARHRFQPSRALELLPARVRSFLLAGVALLVPGRREVLAAKHLRGSGIEIGAMHSPLRVPAGVAVQYVDYFTREENLARFPELRSRKLVHPDFVEDGFLLPSFASASTDFVIANHVLEHAENALATLARWGDVLKAGGKLFLTVPLAEHCFDKGRPITTLGHFIRDYELAVAGRVAEFKEDTLNHYGEWLSVSYPAILAGQGDGARPPADPRTADELLRDGADIHFHTFTVASFAQLLGHFCRSLRNDFTVLEIVDNGGEVIGVVQRAA